MNSGKINKPFELSEIFMFGSRITSPGERFVIDKKWQEGDCLYCHVTSEAGGGGNFEMLAVVANASINYLILTSTPDVSFDDPVVTGMVVRLDSPESAMTIMEEELEFISKTCLAIVDLMGEQRNRSVLDYFGEAAVE